MTSSLALCCLWVPLLLPTVWLYLDSSLIIGFTSADPSPRLSMERLEQQVDDGTALQGTNPTWGRSGVQNKYSHALSLCFDSWFSCYGPGFHAGWSLNKRFLRDFCIVSTGAVIMKEGTRAISETRQRGQTVKTEWAAPLRVDVMFT